jgi:hypothetical protein
MAINPYFPASYAGYQNPYAMQMYQNQYNAPATPQMQSGGLIWVQGIEGAKSHAVGAGQSVLLMDSESNCFFIKSADASGMPLPLRVFDYTERNTAQKVSETRTAAAFDASAFVTRDEFEARIAQICGSQAHTEKEGANDGK